MYEPVLSLKSNHFGSNFWDSFSNKINRDVNFYSDLEYEHWILVETNPDIECFCEQPIKISEYYDEKKHDSIIDIWIKWKDGKEEFVEVKYEKDVIEAATQKNERSKKIHIQLSIQEKWSKNTNVNYRIVTEKEIRLQPLLTNRKMLLPYTRKLKKLNEDYCHSVLTLLTEKEMSVNELILKTKITPQSMNETLFYLYLLNKVHIDFSTTMYSLNSKVGIIYA